MAPATAINRTAYIDLGHADHLAMLHGGHDQRLTTCYRDGNKRWREHTSPDRWATNTTLDHLIENSAEAYISQCGFSKSRRSIAGLSTIPAIFSDIDFGDVPAMRRMNAQGVIERIQHDLPDLPPPTLSAASSGKGAYAVWVLTDPLPANRLAEWQPVQNDLCRILKPYGADPRARDAARVLRVPGSTHQSGSKVHYWQTGPAYSFHALQSAIKALAPPPPEPRPIKRTTTGQRPARLFNGFTLAHARLNDLRLIARNRGKLDDFRKRFMFVYSCCAAWFLHTADDIARETELFAQDYFQDAQRYTRRLITTTLRRFDQAKSGVLIPWNSPRGIVEVDQRYRLRNETIMEWLGVDDSELTDCSVIIPARLKQERNRQHKEAQRRRRGAQDRSDYLSAAAERKQGILGLLDQGVSVKEIAEQFSCSRRTVELARKKVIEV